VANNKPIGGGIVLTGREKKKDARGEWWKGKKSRLVDVKTVHVVPSQGFGASKKRKQHPFTSRRRENANAQSQIKKFLTILNGVKRQLERGKKKWLLGNQGESSYPARHRS